MEVCVSERTRAFAICNHLQLEISSMNLTNVFSHVQEHFEGRVSSTSVSEFPRVLRII